MITLDDHHGGKPRSPVCETHTRSEAAAAVSDAIANLERALVAAGNAPGTFGLILGNGAVYVNEPVVMKAAQDLVNRGKIVATSHTGITKQKLFDNMARIAGQPVQLIEGNMQGLHGLEHRFYVKRDGELHEVTPPSDDGA